MKRIITMALLLAVAGIEASHKHKKKKGGGGATQQVTPKTNDAVTHKKDKKEEITNSLIAKLQDKLTQKNREIEGLNQQLTEQLKQAQEANKKVDSGGIALNPTISTLNQVDLASSWATPLSGWKEPSEAAESPCVKLLVERERLPNFF